MRAALFSVAAFGIPGTVPVSASGTGAEDVAALRAQVQAVSGEVQRRLLAEASVKAGGTTPVAIRDHALARLRELFGPSFRVLPRFKLSPNPTTGATGVVDLAFASSNTLQGNRPGVAVNWLQRAARVREGARRFNDVMLYANLLEDLDRFELAVDQLPRVASDRWVALPFAPAAPPVGRLSVAVHRMAEAVAGVPLLAGLMVDEWAEVIPNANETTGLAFHYDAPGACAPQAVVLAVPPENMPGWTLDTVTATVRQTLELARARAVDRDALAEGSPASIEPTGTGHFLPALLFALNLKGATVATDLQNGRGRGVT